MTDANKTEMLNAMLEVSESFDALTDMVEQRRDDFIRRGFSPTAAEQMALMMWAAMMKGGHG